MTKFIDAIISETDSRSEHSSCSTIMALEARVAIQFINKKSMIKVPKFYAKNNK